jgi:hypothetical protein
MRPPAGAGSPLPNEHSDSDHDASTLAGHHTLGTYRFQGSPGNHTHSVNDPNSVPIFTGIDVTIDPTDIQSQLDALWDLFGQYGVTVIPNYPWVWPPVNWDVGGVEFGLSELETVIASEYTQQEIDGLFIATAKPGIAIVVWSDQNFSTDVGKIFAMAVTLDPNSAGEVLTGPVVTVATGDRYVVTNRPHSVGNGAIVLPRLLGANGEITGWVLQASDDLQVTVTALPTGYYGNYGVFTNGQGKAAIVWTASNGGDPSETYFIDIASDGASPTITTVSSPTGFNDYRLAAQSGNITAITGEANKCAVRDSTEVQIWSTDWSTQFTLDNTISFAGYDPSDVWRESALMPGRTSGTFTIAGEDTGRRLDVFENVPIAGPLPTPSLNGFYVVEAAHVDYFNHFNWLAEGLRGFVLGLFRDNSFIRLVYYNSLDDTYDEADFMAAQPWGNYGVAGLTEGYFILAYTDDRDNIQLRAGWAR